MKTRRDFLKTAAPALLAVPLIPLASKPKATETTVFYSGILCVAGCGCVMMNERRGKVGNYVEVTRCTNPECKGCDIWYKIPTIEIERLPDNEIPVD